MGVIEHRRHSKHVTRTRRWAVLRQAILERDGWKCRDCGARGRLEVHHVKPVRTHPGLAFLPGNLLSLCASCHTKHTRIECGHAPPKPEIADWRKAVASLAAEPRGVRAAQPERNDHAG